MASIGLGGLTTPTFGVRHRHVLGGGGRHLADERLYHWPFYLAGLRGIPGDIREAALVDGANEWQVLRYITVPLLKPITLSAVIILGHISLKIV